MPIEEFIIAVFCCIEDLFRQSPVLQHLRQRGPQPQLCDSEVLTMEVVGEFLGKDEDKAIWKYFRSHWHPLFPRLGSRSAFVRQGANLWFVKQFLQAWLSQKMGAWEDTIHLVDGFPLPICHFKRAPQSRIFRGEAAYGYCASKEETYYGLRGNLVVSFNGTITGFTLTAANVDERDSLSEIVEHLYGLLIGDKGYIRPELKIALKEQGLDLQTPLRSNMKDTRDPHFVKSLTRTRRLIETVIGQLSEQFHIESTKARDLWHLTSRIARKLLAHTIGVFLNLKLGRQPLHLEGLIQV